MKKTLIITAALMAIVYGMHLTAAPRPQRLIKQFFAQEFLKNQNLLDGRFILRFKDQLNLTGDQIQKIEKLMLTFEEEYISRWAEIKIKEIHLASYIKSEQIVRKKIENTIREISKERIEISIKYLNYLLDIKMLLTREQKEKIKNIKKHPLQQRNRSFEQ
jgi:Spy/CpxP family protein refolding chaperone